ncbi:MAG TPA: serine protease [Thermoanaerobaculia bacterium]|jgi:hypothetical protein
MVRWPARVLALTLVPAAALAVEINPVQLPNTPTKEAAPKALRLAETRDLPPLATLKTAAAGAGDQLDAIAAWNRSGNLPARNGFARPLPAPKAVRFTADLLKRQPDKLAGGALLVPPAGGMVWGTEVRVADAHRLRLHLANVHLPAGTRMWVYDGDGKEEVAFEPGAVLSGDELWTPSVAGPAIRFEVRLPEGAVEGQGFTIDKVLELFQLNADGSPVLGADQTKEDFSCARDAACYNNTALSVMDLFKHADAYLEFVDAGQGYSCSGSLLNDTDDATTIPYLLTAHHCFSTQAAASTLEAFFDYISTSCNGTAPALGSLPRTSGSTLLATGAATDFTFVRLPSLPPGRGLLGVVDAAVANGAQLYRLSHPLGISMGYSVTTLTTTGPTCSDATRPNFLYSVRSLGGTFEGSSGSPDVRSDGKVVGQLTGACGPTAQADEGCDAANYMVDGAMSGTFASIAQWLTPATTTNPGPCVPGDTTLCLGAGGRFKVEATFDTGSQQGQAQAVKLTDETGYLWFFSASNVELVVKVLDACSYNQRFWVFAGGLTNVQVTLTVTDTVKGTVKTYNNPQGTAFQPIQDTGAFATCN